MQAKLSILEFIRDVTIAGHDDQVYLNMTLGVYEKKKFYATAMQVAQKCNRGSIAIIIAINQV